MSSHFGGHLRQVDHPEVRKLSANSIVRLLKTELAPTSDLLYALVTIKQAFATSLHIKHNLDKWDMLEESPLDTYDPEDEYVMAERDADPSSVTVDMNINLFEFIRKRKKEYWHKKSYPEVLATAMESYLKRREGLEDVKSIRRGWYPYPDYSTVDLW
ncbi:hypothetical protein TWF569_005255 [Orbilia oligospora]|nr:hypothetical protein TWF706_005764 [Orbilia oligospora]KAF3149189.1 hypothetical protein TWF569_005255 [Orbilia oligospora]